MLVFILRRFSKTAVRKIPNGRSKAMKGILRFIGVYNASDQLSPDNSDSASKVDDKGKEELVVSVDPEKEVAALVPLDPELEKGNEIDDGIISCPVCMNTYSNSAGLTVPTTIPCGHSLCQTCYNSLPKPGGIVSCPVCRDHSQPQNVHPTFLIMELIGHWMTSNSKVQKLLRLVKNPRIEEDLREELTKEISTTLTKEITASLSKDFELTRQDLENRFEHRLREAEKIMELRIQRQAKCLLDIHEEDTRNRIQTIIESKNKSNQIQLDSLRRINREEIDRLQEGFRTELQIVRAEAELHAQQKVEDEKAALQRRILELEGKGSSPDLDFAVGRKPGPESSAESETVQEELLRLKTFYEAKLAAQRSMMISELESLRRLVSSRQNKTDDNSEEFSRIRQELADARALLASNAVSQKLREPGSAEREILRLEAQNKELQSEIATRNSQVNQLKVELFDALRPSRPGKQADVQYAQQYVQPLPQPILNNNNNGYYRRDEAVVARSKTGGVVFLGKNT
jgi:hypothetical protein